MAKKDFHVLAYRVLAYLYQCVRERKTPDPDVVSADTLGIEHAYWQYIMRNLALRDMCAEASTVQRRRSTWTTWGSRRLA